MSRSSLIAAHVLRISPGRVEGAIAPPPMIVGEGPIAAQVLRGTSPAPRRADEVVAAFCAVMEERGTPWTEPRVLEQSVRQAMTRYDARATLLGLGMWEAEQACIPRQVPEWVRKALRQGPIPDHLNDARALVDEGQERYRRYLARRAMDRPSKADERRQRSLAAIIEFARDDS